MSESVIQPKQEAVSAVDDAPDAVKGSKMSLGARVFQNTAAQLGGRVIGIFFSAATSILLARYLGREKLGQYGAIYAYLALYGFFATFCLEQILAREISVRRDKAAEIFHTGTLTALGFSVVGALVAIAAAPLLGYSGELRWLIAIAAIDLLILPPFRFRGIIFQVEMRLWYSVAIGLVRQALWLVAVVLLAMKNAAFYEVIIARTAVGLVEALLVMWTVRRVNLVQGTRKFISDEAWMMLREGFPLVLTTLAVGIYHRIDQVMLHKMSGDQVLGPYVIAVQLTELFSALPVALMVSLFPALAQSAKDEEKFRRYLGETYRFLLVIAFAACALVTPIAAPVLELFYGKQYLPTASLLIVLIWSEVPIFFGVALGSALVARGMQKYTPMGAIVGAVVNVILNLALIPRYGALGASWATVISYSIAGIFFLLLIRDIRGMVTTGLRIAVWPFVLAVGITAGLHFLALPIWCKLMIAFAVYSAGVWLTGTVRQADLDRVRGVLGKRLNHV
jgi:O-antigen/teichoic acid export membrane protein